MDVVQDIICNHGNDIGNHGNNNGNHDNDIGNHGNHDNNKDQMSLCNVSGVGNVSYNQQTLSFIVEMEHRMKQVGIERKYRPFETIFFPPISPRFLWCE